MTAGAADLVRYRLARARETLDAASALLRDGHLHDAVNRLYYACFYAVSALLLTDGLASPKHTGVRALFDKHWVKTGRLPLDAGKLYRVLFKQRHRGDYDDLVVFAREDVAAWLERARTFVADIASKVEDRLDESRPPVNGAQSGDCHPSEGQSV